MSCSGPMMMLISEVYRRVIRSSSPWDMDLGSQITPPLAPPKGMLTVAHFQVIQEARAFTSSSVTSGWYRMPPLPGPRAMLCWTRYPSKTFRLPLSILVGMETMSCRLGFFRTCRIPGSRLRRSAALSNCFWAIWKAFRFSTAMAITYLPRAGTRASRRAICPVAAGLSPGTVLRHPCEGARLYLNRRNGSGCRPRLGGTAASEAEGQVLELGLEIDIPQPDLRGDTELDGREIQDGGDSGLRRLLHDTLGGLRGNGHDGDLSLLPTHDFREAQGGDGGYAVAVQLLEAAQVQGETRADEIGDIGAGGAAVPQGWASGRCSATGTAEPILRAGPAASPSASPRR